MTDQSIPRKYCPCCKTNKLISEFSSNRSKTDGLSTACKKCDYARVRKYMATPRGKAIYNAAQVRYRSSPKNRAAQRRHRLLKRYGVTAAIYDALYEAQQSRCAICQQSPNGKPLGVDHDHRTNKVRGLLCDPCNQALGSFREDSNILQSAIEYLKKHKT